MLRQLENESSSLCCGKDAKRQLVYGTLFACGTTVISGGRYQNLTSKCKSHAKGRVATNNQPTRSQLLPYQIN